MASIKLHKEKGVNAHMTTCPKCGGDGDELIMLGSENNKYTCPKCDALHYGRPDTNSKFKNLRMCQKCEHPFDSQWKKDVIEDWEKLPSHEPCKKCAKGMNLAAEVVKEGGIFWRCKDCHSEGAIHAHAEVAKLVREQSGVKAPDPVGVEFTKDEDCPVCSENAVVSEDES